MATSGQYDHATLSAIWNKATIVPLYDPNVYRRDSYGSLICWNSYGSTTLYGWEVDHIKPVALGGSDALGNLQPLHWINNRKKSDNRW